MNWITTIYCKLNNILNWITLIYLDLNILSNWIFLKLFWIEYIELNNNDSYRFELNIPKIILNWILNWINFAQNSNFELNQFGYRTGLAWYSHSYDFSQCKNSPGGSKVKYVYLLANLVNFFTARDGIVMFSRFILSNSAFWCKWR